MGWALAWDYLGLGVVGTKGVERDLVLGFCHRALSLLTG